LVHIITFSLAVSCTVFAKKNIFSERNGQTADGEHIAGVRGQLRQRERHVCLQEVVTPSRSSRRRRTTGDDVSKLFYSSLTLRENKLECLSMATFFSLG